MSVAVSTNIYVSSLRRQTRLFFFNHMQDCVPTSFPQSIEEEGDIERQSTLIRHRVLLFSSLCLEGLRYRGAGKGGLESAEESYTADV